MKILFRNMILILCPLAVAAILVADHRLSAQGTDGGTAPKKWGFIAEPVFDGDVWFHQGGVGHDETVMLVHGVGELASKIWEPLIPELEKKYHVIAFDLPGFGRSARGDLVYSPENYAKFLRFIAGKYAGKKLTVVGHSLGGAVALYYAGTYPKKLDRLVIIDAAGVLHRAAFVKGRFMISGKVKDNIFAQKPVSILNRIVESVIGDIDSNIMPDDLSGLVNDVIFRKGILKNDPQKIAGMALIGADFSGPLYAVEVPTAVIWGGKDEIAPVRTASAISAVVPASFLRIMPESGHNPMIDEPDKFRKAFFRCLGMKADKFRAVDDSVPKGSDNVELRFRSNVTLKGNYGTVTVDNCEYVTLKDLRAERVIIKKSTVILDGCILRSQAVALEATDSMVEMNGVRVYGDVAVKSSNSSFDCAGVTLAGKTAAVTALSKSKILFSVSRTIGPAGKEIRHGIVTLPPGTTL